MNLTISAKNKKDLVVLDMKELDLPIIKNYVRDFLEKRKVEKCYFKLEGEAEFVKDVSLCCLFG